MNFDPKDFESILQATQNMQPFIELEDCKICKTEIAAIQKKEHFSAITLKSGEIITTEHDYKDLNSKL